MGKLFKQIGWGGVIGLVAGGFGMLVAFLSVLPAGPYAITFFLLFAFGFCWVFWHFMFGPMVHTNKLLEIGESAEATIVRVTENGMSLKMGGSLPKAGVNILLEVHPYGRAPYQATTKTFISVFEIGEYRPGMSVSVKVNPKNEKDVIIVQDTEPLEHFDTH